MRGSCVPLAEAMGMGAAMHRALRQTLSELSADRPAVKRTLERDAAVLQPG